MTKEELYRADARRVLSRIDLENTKGDPLTSYLEAELWRFRESDIKAYFLDEAIHYVQSGLESHLLRCTVGPTCLVNQGMEKALIFLQEKIAALPIATNEETKEVAVPTSLSTLHPAVQQVAGSLLANGHYPQAIHASCIALDKAVQSKSGISDMEGATLMTTAFSAKNPILKVAQHPNEQLGFMLLYQGAFQAIRNHYAHNLTEIPAARALEWLGFISALFFKLDEV